MTACAIHVSFSHLSKYTNEYRFLLFHSDKPQKYNTVFGEIKKIPDQTDIFWFFKISKQKHSLGLHCGVQSEAVQYNRTDRLRNVSLYEVQKFPVLQHRKPELKEVYLCIFIALETTFLQINSISTTHV